MKKSIVTSLTVLLLLGSLLPGCGQTAVNAAGGSSGEAAPEISSESISVQEQVSSTDLAAVSEKEKDISGMEWFLRFTITIL